jgi:hypothetical protein
MIQLDPPIPVDTPNGPGWAQLVIDYGPAWGLCWVVFLRDSRECWTYRNSLIRSPENVTFGSPPK